jgi:hypothetical protein
LEDLLDQVRGRFVPANLEHLTYYPPIARWYDGELVECDDGHTELMLDARELRQLVRRGADPDVLAATASLPEANDAVPGASATVRFEPRNFEPQAVAALATSCPLPLKEEMRWAGLPPIEWLLSVPVIWGASKFAGAFMAELGRDRAQAFIEWMHRASAAAREPERDRLVTVAFDLDDHRVIYSVVPIAADDMDDEALLLAFDKLRDVAALAGMQKEVGEPFPGLERAAFLFDDDVWRLAWWTDGTAVYRTRWFNENAPDASRFLGHPLLQQRPPADNSS